MSINNTNRKLYKEISLLRYMKKIELPFGVELLEFNDGSMFLDSKDKETNAVTLRCRYGC